MFRIGCSKWLGSVFLSFQLSATDCGWSVWGQWWAQHKIAIGGGAERTAPLQTAPAHHKMGLECL